MDGYNKQCCCHLWGQMTDLKISVVELSHSIDSIKLSQFEHRLLSGVIHSIVTSIDNIRMLLQKYGYTSPPKSTRGA